MIRIQYIPNVLVAFFLVGILVGCSDVVTTQTIASSEKGTVIGIVYLQYPDTAIGKEGTTVTILETGQSTVTDANGRYHLDSVATGSYTLFEHHDGFGDRWRTETKVVAPGVTNLNTEGHTEKLRQIPNATLYDLGIDSISLTRLVCRYKIDNPYDPFIVARITDVDPMTGNPAMNLYCYALETMKDMYHHAAIDIARSSDSTHRFTSGQKVYLTLYATADGISPGAFTFDADPVTHKTRLPGFSAPSNTIEVVFP